MNPSSLGQKILRGVFSSMMGQGAALMLSLLLTPWIVKNLGPGGYGLYALMWSVLSYLLVLHLGSFAAAQRFTAQWHLLDDKRGVLAALLRKTLAYGLFIGVFGGAALFFLRNRISIHFLHGSAKLLVLGPDVFGFLALAIPFYIMAQFSLSILWGLKQFSRYNALMILQAGLITGGASLLLFIGLGLKAIAVLFIFAQALLALVGLWGARELFREPATPLKSSDLREYLSFCVKSALPLFFVTLVSQGDRAAIGLWLPLTQLGYYALSATLAQKFNSISASIAATSFPILAELIGKGEEDRLKRVYLKSAELSFFMLLPLSILSFILIPQFMSLWLGPSFSQYGTWPFRILVVANFMNLSIYMPNQIATGKGSPHWVSYVWIGKALIAAILWRFFIPRWGISGAALGVLIAEILMSIPYLQFVHSHLLGIGPQDFFERSLARPALASSGLFVFGIFFHAMIGGWVGLFGFGCLGTILYSILSYWVIDSEAKALILGEISLKMRR